MDEIEVLKREIHLTRLAYRSAIALARWKSSFLGRAAHELRAPLGSLIGVHQLILADLCESPEEEREFIARAHRSARKLLEMLDEILVLSKLEAGNIALERRPVLLKELFQDLELLTRLPARSRNLALEVLPVESEIAIIADFRRLSNALSLVIDAAIAGAENGTIRIFQDNSTDETVTISLELPCPALVWQEIPDGSPSLIEGRIDLSPSLSPGFRFELARDLVELLGGQIDYREMPGREGGETITRVDCFLPRSPVTSPVPTGND